MTKAENIKFDIELNDRHVLREVLKNELKNTQAEMIHKVADGLLTGDEALSEIEKVEKLFDKINEQFRTEQYEINK